MNFLSDNKYHNVNVIIIIKNATYEIKTNALAVNAEYNYLCTLFSSFNAMLELQVEFMLMILFYFCPKCGW